MDILSIVKNNPENQREVQEELALYDKQTQATKAIKGAILLVQNHAFGKVVKLMGDEIYDLGIENNILKKESKINEDYLNQKKEMEKLSKTEEEKNKFIYDKMKKRCTQMNNLIELNKK